MAWRKPGSGDTDALAERLRALETQADIDEATLRVLNIVLDLAGVQADALLSMAAEKVGDADLEKSSLRSAAESIKKVIGALEQENARAKESSARRREELAKIKEALGG